MAGGMPILGQGDMSKAFGETIDDRHHGIAIAHRKRSAGAKIVLHVDNQQQIIVRLNPHFIPWTGVGLRTLAQKQTGGGRELLTDRNHSRFFSEFH
jgi:hypothetical protein